MLLIVFAAGVYVGTKLDDFGLLGEKEAAAPVAPVTETRETISRSAAEPGDTSPGFAGRVAASSGDEGKSPYEAVTIVEGGRITVAGQGEAPDTAEVGLTSISPERLSPTAEEATVLSPETGTPEGGTAPQEAEKKPSAGESYTLQVAAFATPDEARKVVNEYRGKGYNAYTVEIENSRGEKWTLVKIGKYGSIEQAWSQATVFKKREGAEAFVETLGQKTAVNESWQKSPGSNKESNMQNAN
ncbi:MAG TPA: SPOR domain-containing protein [Thermodesulfobacteriota bacterium]|nr:SPOR domain-containing protein [Thermodesulfobacteriota bacterium]